MPQRALIRPAGKMSAKTAAALRMTSAITAMALLSTAAPATSFAQEVLSNVQLTNGAVSSSQTLNVVENDGLTSASGQATGNSLGGGNTGVAASLTSSQVMYGNTSAVVEINGTNTGQEDISLGTPVEASTQATGNYTGFVANEGNLTANSNQHSEAASVVATTAIDANNNAIYGPDESQGDASTIVNNTSYQVTQGALNSTSVQSSTTDSKANTSVTLHYSPSPNTYTAESTNNYYSGYSDTAGTQTHEVQQTDGGATQSRAEVYAGNVWDTSVADNATGNSMTIENAGGSLDVTNRQNQTGDVQAQGYMSADQYGTANVSATGVGNLASAGNNDVTLRLDNTQISSGGVEVSAEFAGNTGYDGYVTANAIGNEAVAYACSECQADMNVSNSQTNNSDVSASATASANAGRSIVSTAHATGNSATFYVTGGSH